MNPKTELNISKSLNMQDRGRKCIPGLTQLLSKRPDQFAPGSWPGYFEKAKGVEVWDLDGNHYIDMSISGIGAIVLGYCDPDVDKAVQSAIEKGSFCSLNCPEEVELAELLCEIHPWAESVRYGRGGGEAMTIAVRIARAHTGREKIAFCGYHGWHDWYLAANLKSDQSLNEHLLPGLEPRGVPRGLAGTALPFYYNKLEELEQIIKNTKGELAAIVMEPIRSHNPEPGFLESVRKLANKIGAVLIFDEVSAGFRMNSGGSHLLLGVEPDMAVFAKAMSNGYPMGAIIGRKSVMDSTQDTFISSTYWTDRIGPAAALATIRKHREKNVGDHLVEIGKLVQEGWKRIAADRGLKIEVGGIAPMGHFSFEYPEGLAMMTIFTQDMLQRGFLAANRFYANYAHSKEHVEKYFNAAKETFSIIAEAAAKNKIKTYLKGEVRKSGFQRLT